MGESLIWRLDLLTLVSFPKSVILCSFWPWRFYEPMASWSSNFASPTPGVSSCHSIILVAPRSPLANKVVHCHLYVFEWKSTPPVPHGQPTEPAVCRRHERVSGTVPVCVGRCFGFRPCVWLKLVSGSLVSCVCVQLKPWFEPLGAVEWIKHEEAPGCCSHGS